MKVINQAIVLPTAGVGTACVVGNISVSVKSCQVFWLIFIVSLYCLHSFRGLSFVYAALPPTFSVIGSVLLLVKKKRVSIDRKGLSLLVLFGFSSVLPVYYSFLWYPDEAYVQSFFRYFFLVPFFIFALIAIDSYEAVIVALKSYAFFVVIGALSIFYQVVFGPISWFAEASEREGLVRFSSLLGSLTAYGVYSVFALPVIIFLFHGKFSRIAMLIVVVTGMLLTLQKAAVMNIFAFLVLTFFYEHRRVKLGVVISSLVGIIALFAAYSLDISYVVSTVDNVLRLRSDSGLSDVSVYKSVIDRLWALPAKLYELHGVLGMAFGVGMVGGSGTLGFINFPMSHNGLFDLLFIGGVLNLLAFLSVWFVILGRIRHCSKNQFGLGSGKLLICKVSLYIWLLFIINFIFSGILYFQPYGGVVFYTLLVFFLLHFESGAARHMSAPFDHE